MDEKISNQVCLALVVSGDSRPDLQGGGGGQVGNSMTIVVWLYYKVDFWGGGVWGMQPPEAAGFLQFEDLETA